MEDLKHTPGPWRIIGEDYPKGEFVSVVPDDPNVSSIAYVRKSGNGIANAKLISAAPDLLAVLQAFEKVDDFSGWHPNYRDAIEAARAAILKATK